MYSTSTERERFLLEFFFGLQQQPKNKSRLGYEKKLDSWFQTDSVLQLLTCSMYKLYSMSSLFSYVHIFYFLRVWFIKKIRFMWSARPRWIVMYCDLYCKIFPNVEQEGRHLLLAVWCRTIWPSFCLFGKVLYYRS